MINLVRSPFALTTLLLLVATVAGSDLPAIPRVFLTSKDEDVTEARIRELATFATGIAPEKVVIARHPEMVARARGGPHRHVVDVQRHREDLLPQRPQRDVALPLHARHRRAVHQQSGSVPAALDHV